MAVGRQGRYKKVTVREGKKSDQRKSTAKLSKLKCPELRVSDAALLNKLQATKCSGDLT